MKVTFRIENKRLCKALEKGTRKVLLEVGYHGGSDEAKKVMSITRSPYTIDDLPLEWFTFVLKTKGYEPLVIDRNYMDHGQSIDGEEDLISITFKGENSKRIFVWGILVCLLSFLGFIVAPLFRGYAGPDESEKPLSLEIQKGNANVAEKEGKLDREALIARLHGKTFTMGEVEQLKNMDPTEEEQALIKSCEACFRLLNISLKEKDEADKQIRAEIGFIYQIYQDLTVHKTMMDEIILGKYRMAYRCVNRQDFTTIQEAMDVYRHFYIG